jgi:hypothetical protein
MAGFVTLRRVLGLFAATFAVATAAFWATMLTDPPKTEAAAGTAPAAVTLVSGDTCVPFTVCR